MSDGSVTFFTESISQNVFNALGSREGGESIAMP
jgi:hypothetical protein